MKRLLCAASVAAFSIPSLALAQAQLPTREPAKPAAPAAKDGPVVATVNGVAIPRQRADFIVRQQMQRGAKEHGAASPSPAARAEGGVTPPSP